MWDPFVRHGMDFTMKLHTCPFVKWHSKTCQFVAQTCKDPLLDMAWICMVVTCFVALTTLCEEVSSLALLGHMVASVTFSIGWLVVSFSDSFSFMDSLLYVVIDSLFVFFYCVNWTPFVTLRAWTSNLLILYQQSINVKYSFCIMLSPCVSLAQWYW